MKKFSLKNRIVWGIATIIIFAAGLITSTQLHAAIPAGQLNDDEVKLLTTQMLALEKYEKDLKDAINQLFNPSSKVNNFPVELTRMQELRDEIKGIFQRAIKGGSSAFARNVFTQFRALVQKLSNAQSRWVQAISKKSLEALFDVQNAMNADFGRTQEFIHGGLDKKRNHDGEGLLGHLQKGNHPGLVMLLNLINQDILFIFTYDKHSPYQKGKKAMGDHLVKNKGFKGVSLALAAKYLGL